MSYRIDYGSEADLHKKAGWMSGILLTGVLFSVFLILVSLLWPEGREVLQLMLIPGDPDVTVKAAQTFAAELDCGTNLISAASDFVRNVTGNALFR